METKKVELKERRDGGFQRLGKWGKVKCLSKNTNLQLKDVKFWGSNEHHGAYY